MAKQGKSLESKVSAIAPELVDAASSMSVEELRQEISKRAMLYSESKEQEKEDAELIAAKAMLKVCQAPYREDQKAAQLVITWLTKLVEGRGK